MKYMNDLAARSIPWSADLRAVIRTLVEQTNDAVPEIPRIILWALSLHRVSWRISYDVFADVWIRLQNAYASDKGALTTYAGALVRFRAANAAHHRRSVRWPVRVSPDVVRLLVKGGYDCPGEWTPDSLCRNGYSAALAARLMAAERATRPHELPTILECGEDVSTVDRVIWSESKELLRAYVARLPKRAENIIGSYFQLPGYCVMTVDELSTCYAVSHQRIYQIIDATLKKLRTALPAGIEETMLNRPTTPREQRKQPMPYLLPETLPPENR